MYIVECFIPIIELDVFAFAEGKIKFFPANLIQDCCDLDVFITATNLFIAQLGKNYPTRKHLSLKKTNTFASNSTI